MKNKGFTLVELLGAIVILAIILLLALPPILEHVNKSQDDLSSLMTEIVYNATNLYMDKNKADYPLINGSVYCSTVKDLVDNDFLEAPVIDPQTLEELDLNTIIKTEVTNKNYYFEIVDTCNEVIIKELTMNDLKKEVVTEGDGLYKDLDGIYRYKGLNPNNYIMLGNEEYRIIAIENQGIKVIRSSNYTNSAFDASDNRPSTIHTYCKSLMSSGCNIWSKTSEIKQNGVVSDTIINGSNSGTVTENSTAYTLLHDIYYPTLNSVDKYIVKEAIWNIGSFGAGSPILLDTVREEEVNWKWIGKIGLMTVSEYIQGQSPSSSGYESCLSNIYYNSNCGKDNWLNFGSGYSWTITPSTDNSSLWTISTDGYIYNHSAKTSYIIQPVVYLFSNIRLTGDGTKGEGAYRIVES